MSFFFSLPCHYIRIQENSPIKISASLCTSMKLSPASPNISAVCFPEGLIRSPFHPHLFDKKPFASVACLPPLP